MMKAPPVGRGRRHRLTTANDGAAQGGCRAVEDGAKEWVGGEHPALSPRGDEVGGQKVALRLDPVGRYGVGARGQSHLCTCQCGEGVLEARRQTCRRSGSDGGARRRSGRLGGGGVAAAGAGEGSAAAARAVQGLRSGKLTNNS